MEEKKAVKEFNNYEKEVIIPLDSTSGKERFYVMALEDVDSLEHYWFADGGVYFDDVEKEYLHNDFGEGQTNTKETMEVWNKETNSQDENDLWGIIQNDTINTKYNLEKWFVPSKSEWSAFADMLYTKIGINTSDIPNYNLKNMYWTSTIKRIYDPGQSGYIGVGTLINWTSSMIQVSKSWNDTCYVRLCTKF